METTGLGGHAVVLGANMANLLTARVLADAYPSVTVVQRDDLPLDVAHRRGIPQSLHLHGLQPRGRELLDERFAGFTEQAVHAGAESSGRHPAPRPRRSGASGIRQRPRRPAGASLRRRPHARTARQNCTVADQHPRTRSCDHGRHCAVQQTDRHPTARLHPHRRRSHLASLHQIRRDQPHRAGRPVQRAERGSVNSRINRWQ